MSKEDNGGKDVVDVDADAAEMAAFWSSIEALLASSSSPTAVAEGAGTSTGGEDEFAQLFGKTWGAEADAGSCLVDLFPRMDDELRAEDILQQDIFA
jgi:hypothetical protein